MQMLIERDPQNLRLNSGHQMSFYNGRKGDEKGLGFPARNNSVKVIGFETASSFILIENRSFSFKKLFYNKLLTRRRRHDGKPFQI
jgi:hypothetical protein